MVRLFTRLRDRLSFTLCSALVGVAALAAAPAAQAQTTRTIVVRSDHGGLLGERSASIRQIKAAGQRVELRGTCYSACTMYLGVPDVCVAASAEFGFHGPSWYGAPLSADRFEHWSQVMASNYREPLRSWFLRTARHETRSYYRLSGAELIRMGYPAC